MLTVQRKRGDCAEEVVAEYLCAQAFHVLARNYKVLRGEIDLIAQKNDLVVFVEVKFRQRIAHDYGELVPLGKQRRIIAAARRWVQQQCHDIPISYRFDVAYVLHDHRHGEVTYLPNAFSAMEELW